MRSNESSRSSGDPLQETRVDRTTIEALEDLLQNATGEAQEWIVVWMLWESQWSQSNATTVEELHRERRQIELKEECRGQ